MAEGGDDGQEKTEDPSQKRLDKAKEDGEVLSSKELQVFMTMSMGVALIYALYVFLPPRMGHWIAFFEFGDLNQLNSYIMSRIGDAMAIFIVISAIVGLPIMLTVLATQGALSGGINFAVKSMHFKGNRINPLSGFKRMFSINGLMELAKAVAKVLLLTAAFATVIWLILPVLLNLLSTNLNSALSEAFSALMLALGASLIVLAIIAGIDVAYAIHKHTKKLKMSPQELKDEHKQSEGSPEVKSRIRRLQMEASRRASEQGAAVEQAGEATAIITNPTHFAVALKYVPGEMKAPVILAMGRGKIAERIIAKGEESNVTVFRSPLLARALYFTSEIGQEINDGVYTAVAAVLAYVFRLDRGETPPEPMFEIPNELQFDEFGKALKGN
ncbi:EscU/YscU/HrcU family type III secretion system export apparatus switch protein [Planktomarina temperata]|mgnify:FL=1|jgi:flagellar biosynthetic protein FlhB|nr:EscU/YscU/HrcU family type III secretion system export apparatus switch protein [Planktomarina temperata]MDB4091528.1 EscU/YscU/HrcU family type III secretion system export apparatus switch protein [bacterium]MDP4060440.1 Flagellar biosynthetic protein FlhB [Rhodobacteraceae bacterium LE17]MDA8830663.1 EscU/YscU/HrcU family type III secretion system export apparatus switch protein [Planktomarina temperata]MDA8966725.1 EscU/YscU/HrcU family type III secretion system export apparatus switch pr